MLVACPGCKSTLNLRDDLIGKPIRCGKCAQVLRIPVTIPTPIVEQQPSPPPAPSPPPHPVRNTPQPLNFPASRTPSAPAEEEPLVARLVDDREPAMDDGYDRQLHVDVSNSIPYDEFGRVAWPPVPGLAVFAGSLWCVVGVVCLARIVFPLMRIATARGRLPESFYVMACVVMLAMVLFGIMFLYCGVTTNRGTARGLVGNGIGSLVFGAYHLFALVWVYLGTAQPFGRTIADDVLSIAAHTFFAAALIFAGIFSLMRITAYKEMRYQRQKMRHALEEQERAERRRRRD
ncbi:MAG: hypothetical protein U0744_13315 [Gemmataceae bacterium]